MLGPTHETDLPWTRLRGPPGTPRARGHWADACPPRSPLTAAVCVVARTSILRQRPSRSSIGGTAPPFVSIRRPGPLTILPVPCGTQCRGCRVRPPPTGPPMRSTTRGGASPCGAKSSANQARWSPSSSAALCLCCRPRGDLRKTQPLLSGCPAIVPSGPLCQMHLGNLIEGSTAHANEVYMGATPPRSLARACFLFVVFLDP